MLVHHTATAVKKRGGTGITGEAGCHRSCGGLSAMNSSRLCLEADAGDAGDCHCGLWPLKFPKIRHLYVCV